MKSYNEMAADVFRRRDEFLRKRQRRNQILLRTGTVSGFCVLLLSAGILVPAMTGRDPNPGTAEAPLYSTADRTGSESSPTPEESSREPDLMDPSMSDANWNTPATLPDPEEGPDEPLNNTGHFSAYDELYRALKDKDSSIWQELKDNSYSGIAPFESMLSGFSSGELRLLIPMLSGEKLALRDREGFSNITLFTYELYNMPWIWYHCEYQESDLTIQITYPQILNNPEINLDGDYLDLLGVIAPDAPNPENYRDKGYAAAYEKELTLKDGRTVSALVLETDGGRTYCSFLYDGVMVQIWTDAKELLSEDFWREFSLSEMN